MGNRAAKVSEDSKRIDDEDDVSTKEEKQIVIADSREDQEVRAGCVYGMGNSTKGQLGHHQKLSKMPITVELRTSLIVVDRSF